MMNRPTGSCLVEGHLWPMFLSTTREVSLTSEQKLKEAFIQAIGLPVDTDFNTVSYGVTHNWDSVAHMQLIAEIENSFDIMLSTDEVIAMSSFEVAKKLIASHGIELTA
jgi:acyl carrier protein